VYPLRDEGGRWRAVWYEDGERQQCESVSEEKLAAKLEKVRQRLAMGAANMTRPGADLIAWYLNPDRLPVEGRWSRKHADSQRRLCQRFAAPVIGAVTCQDMMASSRSGVGAVIAGYARRYLPCAIFRRRSAMMQKQGNGPVKRGQRGLLSVVQALPRFGPRSQPVSLPR
jgi:hypothetical protein